MSPGPQRRASAGLAEAVCRAAKAGEPDRYLAALLAPARLQAPLVTLAAVAAEIGRIPASVSEPMIGEIRLQWWRDALAAGLAGAPTGHPVADALAELVRLHRFAAGPLERLIDARAFDLTGGLHADDAALDGYLAATEGAMFAIALELCAGAAPPPDLARDAGIAYGLARAFGRLPALWHNGGFPVPASRLAAAGVSSEMLAGRPLHPAAGVALGVALAGLEAMALTALGRVREAMTAARPGSIVALLPLAMVEPYFAAQKRVGEARMDAMAEVAPLARVWHIARARLRRRL